MFFNKRQRKTVVLIIGFPLPKNCGSTVHSLTTIFLHWDVSPHGTIIAISFTRTTERTSVVWYSKATGKLGMINMCSKYG